MTSKPLVTLWSKAAVEGAGESLPRIQRTVRQECGEITEEAAGWFMHVVQTENDGAYLCNGEDEGDVWRVRVRLAEFVPMKPLREDHPDPAMRGKVLSMPTAVDTSDNEAFAEIGYLEH